MARLEADIETTTSVDSTSLQCYIESVLISPEIDSNMNLMKYEWARYISFGSFPQNSPVQPNRLSKSGFFYTGQGDETVCFSCGFRNKNWKSGESPSEVHKRLSPNCNFVNGIGDGNIPILDGNVQSGSCTNTYQIANPTVQSPTHVDVLINEREREPSCTQKIDELTNTCNTNNQYSPPDAKDRPEDALNNSSKFSEGQSPSSTSLDKDNNLAVRNLKSSAITDGTPVAQTDDYKLEIPKSEHMNQTRDSVGINVEKAKHPHYSSLTSRLESFRGWPSVLAQRPSELAAAGLYYVGVGDSVRCFCCGGGLRGWEEGDNPREEHARIYPNCALSKKSIGQMVTNIKSEGTTDIESYDLWGTSEMRSGDGACNMEINSTVEESPCPNSMDSPAVQSILSMGYSLEMVRQAMERLESTKGHSHSSENNLLEVVFDIEEAQTSKQSNAQNSTKDMVKKPKSLNGSWLSENAHNERKNSYQSRHDNSQNKVKEGKDSLKSSMSSIELESLLEQNQELKDQMTCKICMDREASIVFLPCGHIVACPECAPAFRKCPACRQLIKDS